MLSRKAAEKPKVAVAAPYRPPGARGGGSSTVSDMMKRDKPGSTSSTGGAIPGASKLKPGQQAVPVATGMIKTRLNSYLHKCFLKTR